MYGEAILLQVLTAAGLQGQYIDLMDFLFQEFHGNSLKQEDLYIKKICKKVI